MKNKLLSILISLAALCGAVMAQDAHNAPRTIHVAEKSAAHVTAPAPPPALATIFNNLGYSRAAYNDSLLEVVSGPASSSKVSFSVALPFTPKNNALVREVRAAVQYGGTGANQVNLSLYSDVGGVPGTILAGPFTVANLPDFGTCCELATWKLSPQISVNAGIRYWIVADTPATGLGSDFYGLWATVHPTPFLQASNVDGFGWNAFYGGYLDVAGAVYGTIQ